MIYATVFPATGIDMPTLKKCLGMLGVTAISQDGVICIIAPEQPREMMIKIDGIILGISAIPKAENVVMGIDKAKSILMRRHLWPHVTHAERLAIADCIIAEMDLSGPDPDLAILERFKQLQDLKDQPI